MRSTSTSLSERLIAAGVSAFFMAITAIAVPVGVRVLSRGRGWELLGLFGQFHVWAFFVVACAAFAGFCLGNERTTVFFAHLWFTEQPRKLPISLCLWAALAITALVSHWLFGKNAL